MPPPIRYAVPLALILIIGCSDASPVAIPTAPHAIGEVDYPMPDGASRAALADRFEARPVSYIAIECSDTYQDVPGAEPVPSLWVSTDDATWAVSGDGDWYLTEFNRELQSDSYTLTCVDRVESIPEAGEAWGAFVYSRELLASNPRLRPHGPFFDFLPPRLRAEVDAMGEPWTRASIERLLEIRPQFSARDSRRHWRTAIQWAEERGDDDLLFELLRSYRPAAMCSQDDGPARHTARLRNLCLRTGRLSCAAKSTGLLDGSDWPSPYYLMYRRLPTSIDRETYVLGTLMQFPGSPGNELVQPSSTPPRLHADDDSVRHALRARIIEIATQPGSDALTRHHLGLAYAFSTGVDAEDDPSQIYRELADEDWLPLSTRAEILRFASRSGEVLVEIKDDLDAP